MIAHDHPEVRGAEFVVFANEERRYTGFHRSRVRFAFGYSRDELRNKSVEDVSFKMDNVPQVFAQFVQRGAMEGDYVLPGTRTAVRFEFTFAQSHSRMDAAPRCGRRSRVGASRIWRR